MEFESVLAAFALFILAALAVFILLKGLRVYREHERGVRFRLGRFNKVTGPGISFSLPYLDSTTTVDTRLQQMELSGERLITKDKATVFVDAVARYKISAPERALTRVANCEGALRALFGAALRNAVGEVELRELLEKREFINARLREAVSGNAEKWGMEVESAELMDAIPSQSAHEMLLLQASAERKRREMLLDAQHARVAALLKAQSSAEALKLVSEAAKARGARFLPEGAVFFEPPEAEEVKKTGGKRRGNNGRTR